MNMGNVGEVPPKKFGFGTGGGFGGGLGDRTQHAMPAPRMPSQSTSHIALPGTNPVPGGNGSAGDCHYFLQGTCSKGNSCLFRHNQAAKVSGTVCRFWQNGFCKDAANCSFQHPSNGGRGHGRTGPGGRFGTGRGMGGGRGVFAGGRGGLRTPAWEAVDRSQQPCVFFGQGKCTKGDLCQFSHASAVEGGNSRATDSSSAPPRADTPEERVRADAEKHSAHMQTSLSGGTPQIAGGGKEGTNAIRIGKTGYSGQVLGDARLPAERQSGSASQDAAFGGVPSTIAPPLVVGNDGNTYVIGPDGPVLLDAVMRTMAAAKVGSVSSSSTPHSAANVEKKRPSTKFHDNSYQARGADSSRLPEKAPTQSGVIALPDGGFVTRKKRAAEMQLLRGDRGEKDNRSVRQRDVREQEQMNERRPAMPENRGAPTGGRVSIMDRLGPAKPVQAKPVQAKPVQAKPVQVKNTLQRPVGSVRWPIAADNRPAAPVHRLVAPDHPITRKQETRAHSAPTGVDRSKNGAQISAPSALSRSQALGTTRFTRRLDGEKGDIVSPGKGLVVRPTVQRKAGALDFKVPTLGEIKSRKAKAEGIGATASTKAEETGATATTKPEGRAAVKSQTYNGSSATPGNNGEIATPNTSSPAVLKEVNDPDGESSPAPVVHPVLPKLDAADMDEFSEWL